MRNRTRCLLPSLAAVCALTSTPAAQQPPPPPQGAISGVVVDAITGAPLSGARVSLNRTDNLQSGLPRIVTDAKGRFVFRNLPAAKTYFLDAARFGFATTRYGWTGPGQSSAIREITTIPVTDGQWVSDIRIPLWRYGSISGRVLDERNEPVVGVAVRAFTSRAISGRQRVVAGPLTTTDDRGNYRLGGIEPGSYIVSVLSVQQTVLSTTVEAPVGRPIGALAESGVGGGRGSFVGTAALDADGRHRLVVSNYATPPAPSSGSARAYPPVFYPASPTLSGAQAIEINYGDTRTGIDLQIAPVPAVRVSGRIDGAAGATPDLLLRLLPSGSESLGFGAEVATTQLAKDGSFTFLNVPAGDYTLLAQAAVLDFVVSASANTRVEDAPGYPGQRASVGSMRGLPGIDYLSRQGTPTPFWGRMGVSVSNVAIDDLVLPMRNTVKVTGRFVFADGTPPPNPTHDMLITMDPLNGDPSLGEPMGQLVTKDPALPFTIEGLLGGTYRLSSHWFDYGIVSVVSGGRDLNHAGFDASQGRDFEDVVVTLTSKKPVVTGVVRNDDGPARAAVIAFPSSRARWVDFGWTPMWLQGTTSATDGTFKIEALPEGDYLFIAVDAKLKDQFANPKLLEAAAPLASRISLKWGDTKTLDLRLTEVTIK
jgi:hypothetical protein